MRTGYLIGQILKELQTPDNNDRAARAMFVANAYAFAVDLSGKELRAQVLFDDTIAGFRKLVSQVNENIVLDTKLAETYFRELIAIRCNLILGYVDPALVRTVIESDSAKEIMNRGEYATADWLIHRMDFARSQAKMHAIIQEDFEQKGA